MFRPVKAKRSKRRLSRLGRVKQKLFQPTHPLGEQRISTHRVVIGKQKRMSFERRVTKLQYPPYTIVNYTNSNTEATSGSQAVTTLDITVNNTLAQGFNKVRDIYRGNTAVMEGTMPTTGDSTNPWKGNFKIEVSTIRFIADFLNAANVSADLEIMICTPTRIINSSGDNWANPSGWWTQCNNYARVTANAEAPTAQDGTSGMPITTLGDRPTKITTRQDFGRWWRIVDKKRVVLAPGEQMKHSFVRNLNRTIEFEDLSQIYLMPNVSYIMMVINKGQLVGSSVTGLQLATSDTQVGIDVTRSITYNYVTAARPQVMRTNAAATIAAANQAFINVEDNTFDVYNETL